MPFAPIPEILDELRNGRMVVLTDDEHRENEGDLVLPAQFITPESITFMLGKAMGYLCVAMTEEDCDRLDLHPQAPLNTTVRGTAFTVTIDPLPKHGGTRIILTENGKIVGAIPRFFMKYVMDAGMYVRQHLASLAKHLDDDATPVVKPDGVRG